MAEEQQLPQKPRESGFISKILSSLIISLILSILIEWLCMAFVWDMPGASHSKQMMKDEFDWFSESFQQSLLYSQPIVLLEQVVNFIHKWLFVNTGLQSWLNSPKSSDWELMVFQYIGAYIEATFYVVVTFFIRLLIIVLTCPIFILTAFVGLIDGLVERDLRRFGVGRESAFKYHHAKRLIGPIMIIAWVVYLSIPFSIHPNMILIPSAIFFGFIIRTTAANFKKHL